jgi:pullulanase-type alpha-1,6-glucosidase
MFTALVVVFLFSTSLLSLVRPVVLAQTDDEPSSVVLVGSLATALGCAGSEDAACTTAQLEFNPDNLVWKGQFDLPAGDYTYQMALNGSLDVLVPAEPVSLTLGADDDVTFLYDHRVGWAGDSVNHLYANLPGTLQGPLGCPVAGGNNGNWQPWCLRTLLTDVDGDGIYSFSTNALPAGRYEVKVAYAESWGENYGEGGRRDGPNMIFRVADDGNSVNFLYDPESHILTIETELPPPDISALTAHWVFEESLVWDVAFDFYGTYQLHWDPTGQIRFNEEGTALVGGQAIVLEYAAERLNTRVLDQKPHLADKAVLEIDEADLDKIPEILKSQIVLSLTNAEGVVVAATGVQLPLMLDELYYYDGPLGVNFAEGVPTISVWAPTAQNVNFHLFDTPDRSAQSTVLPMNYDSGTGVWSITGEADWAFKWYLFEVDVFVPSTQKVENNLVTDPYSLSLSLNSQLSQIVDLSAPELKPESWDDLAKPTLVDFEDIVLYELHVRDFSIYDETVPEADRGKFLAFTHADSNGMKHLRALAGAGLTHLHLLPAFDIATIDEAPANRIDIEPDVLSGLPPDSEEQQAMLYEVRDQDSFNWGYDPYHYTVPEGSYASDANGTARIVEFRQMVQSLNQNGLRVVMDVVYNHTNASGQADKSVLDKIVPGYYHRLSPEGVVETSTCCANTATEHRMMEKLMIDSVITWATAYKVDGFRFDLMGHHMVENMVNLRAALDSLTLETHGVDGKLIYVYGEGWNFGEVANNARGVNATQLNIGGNRIGTFNDRLRDAARGGNPFGDYQQQGFINGLYTNPNGITRGGEEEQLARLLLLSDQIKVGLAGNLRDYSFVGRNGDTITGSQVDYNGSPAGYTLDPEEHIVYVSAHDNETLFDIVQYKAPASADLQTRVRMHNMGVSIVALSQGVVFYHAGVDMLRSKSFDKDSYNSGDWFNALDFTYTSNNWGHGLPVADKNQSQWNIQQPLLANPDLAAGHAEIMAAVMHMREMLQIRKSSGLFRLRTAEEIQANLTFLNNGPDQIPGVIVMELVNNTGLANEPYQRILVIFNARNEVLEFAPEGYGDISMTLHPVQQDSADAVVQTASFADGVFSVPAYTTAVFVAE